MESIWRYDSRISYKYYLYRDIRLFYLVFILEWRYAISLVHRLLVAFGSYIDRNTGSIIWSQIGNGRLCALPFSLFTKDIKMVLDGLWISYRIKRSISLISHARMSVYSMLILPRMNKTKPRHIFVKSVADETRSDLFPCLFLCETTKDFVPSLFAGRMRSSIIPRRRFPYLLLVLLFLCVSAPLNAYVFGSVDAMCARDAFFILPVARKISPGFTRNERWASIFAAARIGFVP